MTVVDRLRGAKYAVQAGIAAARFRPYVPSGHYYSPITSRRELDRAIRMAKATTACVDLHEGEQLALAEQLAPMWSETLVADGRYQPDNMYVLSDAGVYASLLRHQQPARVVEVGSGFSSAIALDTVERYGMDTCFTFVEPHTERLEGLLRPTDNVTLYRSDVQDVAPEIFDALGDGDLLFIDSTHVVKPGSDVVHMVLSVLPRLNPGVLVHFHDVFWPFEYPESWLREHRDWTEDYLLHAFLAYNAEFEIILFNDWLWQAQPELIHKWFPAAVEQRPGGLWLRRRRG